ncbi:MAG: OmpA family protein [Campylobacteraceae bacterium]|jgi:OOP family OmpA-OmpF porin|nr:OmpA family protein [Campylobacteraceae bacterium]
MKRVVLGVAASMVLAYAGSSEVAVVVGEVDPIHSHRYNEHTTYGVRAGVGLETALIDQIELGYDYSSNVEYRPKDQYLKDESPLHRVYLNAIKEFEVLKSLKLYVLAGVGYEMFQEDLPQRSRAFGQYGAGLKYYFTNNIALRGEVRQGVEFKSPNRDSLFYTIGFVYSFGSKQQEAAPVTQIEQLLAEIEQAPIQQEEFEEESIQEQIPAQEAEAIEDDESAQPKLALIIESYDNDAVDIPLLTQKNINFEIDSAQIQDGTKSVLQIIASDLQLEEYLNVKVLVKGHTDSTGSDSYNLQLSQKRADAVKVELTEKGVAEDRIAAKGYGEIEPIEPNHTKEGRAANRRAEIIFQ